jgi:PKD repeat protein
MSTDTRHLLAGFTLACALATVSTLAQSGAVTVAIDVAASRRAINPNVYGVAYATPTQLADLNAPLNRYGGNNTSRYNWQLNADNRGQDWYFQSIAEASATPGKRGDDFIAEARSAGAQPAVTIPTIGWIARLGTNRAKLASYSIAKYGPQTGNDSQWFPDAGNGIRASDGARITWNDPADANTPNNAPLQRGWINHLVTRWGVAANGGLKYYILDNEPSLWHDTHRDVRPTGATLDEVREYMLAYAHEVKNADPGALVIGPEEWGWLGTKLSGYDLQYGDTHGWPAWSSLPDRSSHGQMDSLPWLLQQIQQQSALEGRRLIDVFTSHYYPQGGEFSNDTSATMQARRNKSTRSLWDPSYVDDSWIASVIRFIPQLREWVTQYYPGTAIGITEYNWGAEGHINGATTQADLYGIFGREGLDMAARWTTPDTASPTYKAMKIYRNYDGSQSAFGDVSVKTTSTSNPDALSVFGAQRSNDDALTMMVVNKVAATTPVTINLSNFAPSGVAQVYQLTSANVITRLADLAVPASAVALSVPGQSITLVVVPTSGGPVNQAPAAVASAMPTSGAAPLTVAFSASGSSDPDGPIATYAWTFGDGTTGSGPTPTRIYSTAGSFTATLTVTDTQGATASANVAITVTPAPAPPAAPANLSASASGKTVTVRWTDKSSNETGFYVERAAKAKTLVFTRVGQVGANVTAFTQTVTANTWVYRAQAFGANGVSAYSNQATIRVR